MASWMSAIAFATLALSLGNCNPDDLKELGVGKAWSDPKFQGQAATCAAHAGEWRANLRSCFCPTGTLFSVSEGCHQPRWTDDSVGEVQLIGANLEFTSTVQGREGLLRALYGVTVGAERPQRDVFALKLRPISTFDVDNMLALRSEDFTLDMMVELDPQIASGGTKRRPAEPCAQLLKAAFSGLDAESMAVCDSLQRFLDAVGTDALPANAPVWDKYRGDGPRRIELSVVNLPASMGYGVYRMVGKDGVVFVRSAQFNAGQGTELSVLLSAWGSVSGGVVERRIPLFAGAQGILQKQRVYFGQDFAPLKVHDETFGTRQEMRDTVRRWVDLRRQGLPASSIPTDGKNMPIFEPLRAVLFEHGVGFGDDGLAQRLNPRVDELEYFADTGELRTSFFFDSPDALEGAVELTPERPPWGQHGAAVASVLAADLYNARLSMLVPGDGLRPWRVDVAGERLIRKLESERPFLVNMSVVYDGEIGDCESVFGPVFKRFEHEILFVVGAGNSGARNPTTVCPASLAPRYSNVISVGGVNDDGTIGPKNLRADASNYGSETVEIAAPFCTDVMQRRDGVVVTQRQCGTSYAAPSVGNAALRLHSDAPWLTPEQVKETLLASCDNSGIDVACGGALSLEALERATAGLLRPPSGAQAPHPAFEGHRRPEPWGNER